jgi:hypothetical protein
LVHRQQRHLIAGERGGRHNPVKEKKKRKGKERMGIVSKKPLL